MLLHPLSPPMLTGHDLLAKVKELGNVSKSDLVRECGYVSTKKDGTERLNFTAFYEALLDAKGMNLGTGRPPGEGGRGRSLSFITRVQFNGNLMVGNAYTAKLGLEPGDQFEIKLSRKQIRLVPVSGKEYESGDPEVDLESERIHTIEISQSYQDTDEESEEEMTEDEIDEPETSDLQLTEVAIEPLMNISESVDLASISN